MVLALKLHLHTKISSIPFTKLIQSPQTPLFQLIQPIQACSLSPLHLKTRTNPRGFNALYLERLCINGGGGGNGGGVEDFRKDGGGGGGDGGGAGDVVKLFLRGVELLLDPEQAIVRAVGLPGKLVQLCAQAMWQLHLAMMEIGNVVMMCLCASVVLVSAVVTFLVFNFVI